MFEINKALMDRFFYSIKTLRIHENKVNVHGGVITLSIGIYWRKIVVSLLNEKKIYNKKEELFLYVLELE